MGVQRQCPFIIFSSCAHALCVLPSVASRYLCVLALATRVSALLTHCVSCAASLCRSVGAHSARCVCAMLCVCLSKERKLAIVIETLWFAARDFLT